MTAEFEIQLDRLAELLARRGTTEYFANPIVTAERKWFPELLTPDLGSVRTTLARLASYCGLRDLGIEVGLFARERDPNFLPSILDNQRVEKGAAALYMGTHDGTAYFAVEEQMLHQPDQLKGILAHEMAHAWRHSHGLAIEDRQLEEELTDLTTIVLGFGILTANASYSYETFGDVRGAMAYSGSTHRTSGYLPVDTMSFLLAIHAVTRSEDLGRIRRHLGVTQADAFQKAAEWAEMMDLDERLGLPPMSERPSPDLEGASELSLPLSRAGIAIRESLKCLSEQVGKGGGLASSWLLLSVPPCAERNYALVHWGRANLRGGWSRQLHLVADPEWAIQLLVLESFDEGRFEHLAVGFLTDDVCRKRRDLEKALDPLFESTSPYSEHLMPELPAFVLVPDAAALGVSEAEHWFTRAVARFSLDHVARETEWLTDFGRRILDRLPRESEPKPDPRGRVPRDAVRRWWKLVSDPGQAEAEAATLDLTAADLEEIDREFAEAVMEEESLTLESETDSDEEARS